VDQHSNLFPKNFDRYIEPFLGSGSVFFHLSPSQSILSDVNGDLIECYQQIQVRPKTIERHLKRHQRLHCSEYYYDIRMTNFSNPSMRAARFLYLNRTCFNGIYRVNLKGVFNVPIGSKTNVILESDNFYNISKKLENVELIHTDFEATIERATEGDFLYVDPPYTVKHNFNGFLKYNEKIFSWEDQVRLRDSLIAAAGRGASILVSNAAHQSVIDLYKTSGTIRRLSRASVLSAKSSGRGTFEEILVSINV